MNRWPECWKKQSRIFQNNAQPPPRYPHAQRIPRVIPIRGPIAHGAESLGSLCFETRKAPACGCIFAGCGAAPNPFPPPIVTVMPILLLFVSIALGVVAQMLFKSFAMMPKPEGQALFWSFLDPKLIGGLGLYFVAAILYILSLQKINLSVAHPTVAISYVFVVALSHVFFGESLTVYKILGSALILAGVALMWQK